MARSPEGVRGGAGAGEVGEGGGVTVRTARTAKRRYASVACVSTHQPIKTMIGTPLYPLQARCGPIL